LAESITPEDVRRLKAEYPGVPVVTYVNTSAAVKAECDICCTSGNAKEIVEGLGVPRVIMLPDEYLALNTAKLVNCEIITWKGRCVVHEAFTPADIRGLREANPGVVVLAHPECSPEVVAEADYAGSTAGMVDYVAKYKPKKTVLITECSMSDNVAAEYPELEFVRPCNLCPFMKKIELANILRTLETGQHEVVIDPAIAVRARVSVERMLTGWKP
jgi:quinolinate synthase